jgi:hypothetical protein
MRLAVSPIAYTGLHSPEARQNCAELYDTSSLINRGDLHRRNLIMAQILRTISRPVDIGRSLFQPRAAGRAISKAAIIRNRGEFPLQAEHGALSPAACGGPVFRAREGFGRPGAKVSLHSG